MRRPRALLFVACVLLAGCSSGGGPPPTATETPASVESTTKTLPDPLYRLELRGRDDDPVPVTLELSFVDNGTVFYEESLALGPDSLRDYSFAVPEGEPFRATVSAPNASRTVVVGADEGYTVSVYNESAVSVYESGST